MNWTDWDVVEKIEQEAWERIRSRMVVRDKEYPTQGRATLEQVVAVSFQEARELVKHAQAEKAKIRQEVCENGGVL